MKRDMELIRELLLAIEAFPTGHGEELELAGRSETEVGYHLNLLLQAGYIEGHDVTTHGHDGPQVLPSRMTWEGHDFLDAIRDDGVWKKVQEKLLAVGGQSTLEVVKELALTVVRSHLGLA
jgi:hypothetical protein